MEAMNKVNNSQLYLEQETIYTLGVWRIHMCKKKLHSVFSFFCAIYAMT